ncbi:OLC1v1005361C1 [Oldenlandia corymbosa var. corymbosa]|uniref:OLC1v1005361C1 n=1 Tax=Oldenlandia corymbosa var. corymbosa TaxID=529605 RepID=A0AAV1DFP1_OLDCO|nr:OLC1v1005361C1 [Oldenlandia corymbosa var. corymbosa]
MVKGKQKVKKGTKNAVHESEFDEKDESPKELSKGKKGTIDIETKQENSIGRRRRQRSTQSRHRGWETFNAKQFRNVAVPLDYVEPVERDGKKVTMVLKRDLSPEIEYWQSSVFSFVLGANPPYKVMDNYYRKTWQHIGVDKILVLPNGFYVIRSKSINDAEEALKEPITYLGTNHVIVKPRNVEKGLNHKEIKHVPVWVQFHGLELKYWNPATLGRIASTLGCPIAANSCKTSKDRANFPRVLVDVKIHDFPPGVAHFVDEHGNVLEQSVYYEWRPTLCSHCKNYGHGAEVCRKKAQEVVVVDKKKIEGLINTAKTQQWQIVGKKKRIEMIPDEVPDPDELQEVTTVETNLKGKAKEKRQVSPRRYTILKDADEEMQQEASTSTCMDHLTEEQNKEKARRGTPIDLEVNEDVQVRQRVVSSQCAFSSQRAVSSTEENQRAEAVDVQEKQHAVSPQCAVSTANSEVPHDTLAVVSKDCNDEDDEEDEVVAKDCNDKDFLRIYSPASRITFPLDEFSNSW